MKNEKKCLRCEDTFTFKRFDAKYCSQKCRQAAYMDRGLGRVRVNPESLSQSENTLRLSLRNYSNYDRLSIAVLIKLRKHHPKNDLINSNKHKSHKGD